MEDVVDGLRVSLEAALTPFAAMSKEYLQMSFDLSFDAPLAENRPKSFRRVRAQDLGHHPQRVVRVVQHSVTLPVDSRFRSTVAGDLYLFCSTLLRSCLGTHVEFIDGLECNLAYGLEGHITCSWKLRFSVIQ